MPDPGTSTVISDALPPGTTRGIQGDKGAKGDPGPSGLGELLNGIQVGEVPSKDSDGNLISIPPGSGGSVPDATTTIKGKTTVGASGGAASYDAVDALAGATIPKAITLPGRGLITKVDGYGNSLVAGEGTESTPTARFLRVLADALQATEQNNGVGGSTIIGNLPVQLNGALARSDRDARG